MDVLNGQVMDVGLTVIGYFAAAGLGMLLYATIESLKRRSTATSALSAESIRNSAAERASQLQYFDLRGQGGGTVSAASSAPLSVAPRPGRRDRVEIVRLARQMLIAGTTPERVRQTLPISEAELTLLQSFNVN